MMVTALVMLLSLAIVQAQFISSATEQWLTRFLAWCPWLFAAALGLQLPALIAYVQAVRNGAPLFTVEKQVYQPWPAHSHPVARKTAWGAKDPDNDVAGRRTRLKIIDKHTARQSVAPVYKSVLVIWLLVGTTLALFPFLVQKLVFEVPPVEIVALRRLIDEIGFLLAIPGALIAFYAIVVAARKIPLARFDKSAEIAALKHSRFLGYLDWILKPSEEAIATSQIAGLQLISYRSKNYRTDSSNNTRITTQYELNIVLSDGKRYLLAKQHTHKSLQQDAIRLAKFLHVPVWDRCGYYQPDDPDIVDPHDPVLQPL